MFLEQACLEFFLGGLVCLSWYNRPISNAIVGFREDFEESSSATDFYNYFL